MITFCDLSTSRWFDNHCMLRSHGYSQSLRQSLQLVTKRLSVHWRDEILDQFIGGKHPIILLGFQPSFGSGFRKHPQYQPWDLTIRSLIKVLIIFPWKSHDITHVNKLPWHSQNVMSNPHLLQVIPIICPLYPHFVGYTPVIFPLKHNIVSHK